MKRLMMAFMLIAVMVFVAACGGNDSKKEDEGTKGSADNDNKQSEEVVLTIKHQLGETEVKQNPEKVVVFDFGALDTLDELGIEVAALPKATVPKYLSKYEDDKYENVGSLKEPDFEKIHSLKPDLILISSRQAELYDQLSEIAPTVYVGLDTTRYVESFKENMETIAKIFNKEDEMNAELAEVDEQIAKIKEETAALDSKALIVLGTDGKVSAYGPSSRFGLIHDVLGYKAADENIEVSTHGQNITFEYIFETNPDVLFVIDRDAAVGQDSSVKNSIENDLVKKTKAYENDKIVYLNGELWYLAGGGLQSFKAMIDEVEQSIQ